jgi:hypothetical protein
MRSFLKSIGIDEQGRVAQAVVNVKADASAAQALGRALCNPYSIGAASCA